MNNPSASHSEHPESPDSLSPDNTSSDCKAPDRSALYGGTGNQMPAGPDSEPPMVAPGRERPLVPAASAREFGRGPGRESEAADRTRAGGESPGRAATPAPFFRPEPFPPESGQAAAPVKDNVLYGERYRAGVRKCPSCHTYAYVTTGACPDCGEDLQLRPRFIRCSRCGEQANSELAICPHCARTLKAAPSRVWSIGAPALLALLFGVLLLGRFGGFSLSAGGLNGAGLAVNGSGASGAIMVMTPVPAGSAEAAPGESADAEEIPADLAAGEAEEGGAEMAATETEPAAAETGELADSARGGDVSAGTIAMASITAANDEVSAPASDPVVAEPAATEPAGDESVAGENTVSENTPDETGVSVNAGETSATPDAATDSQEELDGETTGSEQGLRGIGGLADGLLNAIERENDATAAGPQATDDDDLIVQAASMPTGPSGQDSDVGDGGDYLLTAPSLRTPAHGSIVDCAAAERLTWSPVPYMDVDHSYVLHVGFVSGRAANGTERVTWVLAQPRPANMTSWELDPSLCSLASADYGRQWRWWVEVAVEENGRLQAISPPSPVWTFVWD